MIQSVTYEEVMQWLESPNGQVSIGISLGPITIRQFVRLIRAQQKEIKELKSAKVNP